MYNTVEGAIFLLLMSLHLCCSLTTKPNVVFILADDFGYNDIGYHAKNHWSDMKTPFLDQLAEAGVKLENYYVQPICTPTRSQLMSGRYQIRTGLQHSYIHPDQANGLPLDNIILPEQLRQCGYDTHMVGKWHLGDFRSEYLPWKRGFNSYFGFLTGSEDYYTKKQCWGSDGCGIDFWSSEKGPINSTWGQYSAHLYAERAKQVISERDVSKPLFLYVAFQSVHAPMQAPDEYIKPFAHIKDGNRRIYGGMVAAMDEAVANITQHLDQLGMLDNTIIVFSTDNGGQTMAGGNNYPLRGRKTTLWEGGVKGVGFVYGKPLGIQGITHKQLLHVSDWLPTLLSATQCPVVNGTLPLDGFNQWQAIKQQEDTSRTEILHNIDPLYSRDEFTDSVLKFDASVHAAIRSGPWKLLTGDPGFDLWVKPPEWVQQHGNGSKVNMDWPTNQEPALLKSVQLYHIESDPYEEIELSDKFPEVVNSLMIRLANYNRTAVPIRFPPVDPKSYPKNNGGYWGPWLD